MKKAKTFNVYEKDGRKFCVVVDNVGMAYIIDYKLVEYAMKHIQTVKDKK